MTNSDSFSSLLEKTFFSNKVGSNFSKEKLEYKFDSLKKSIKQPMTGLAFYKELSQVVKHVGQGHLSVSPSLPKTTKKEVKALNYLDLKPPLLNTD